EWLRGNFIWERFEEDDDRLRTGKQLCHRDPDRHVIGTTPVHVSDPDNAFDTLWGTVRPALFSTGCQAGSLYSDGAFGTPNGLAIPFIFGASVLGNTSEFMVGTDDNGNPIGLIRLSDPYGGLMQSRNMREIASLRDPRYRATADLLELNVDFDLSPELTLSSQTAYVQDEVYSFQDFNRFNTQPVFNDTSTFGPANVGADWRKLAPGGVYCDPQIGCSDTIAGFDISQATAEQFSHEFRLQSDFDGPLNFSLGANYTTFDVLVDYYIMFNLITAVAQTAPFNMPIDGVVDIGLCGYTNDLSAFMLGPPPTEAVPNGTPGSSCPYIDPNPVESIAGDGHNYFRSKNPYELESRAAFGELYWNFTDTMKLTAGLRYTKDRKSFTPVPSQILLATSIIAGGTVNRGYPEKPPIEQEWGEWTGRLGVDWQPDLGWTDESMLYAFYSRGYKGGGANPPKPGFQTEEEFYENASPTALLLFGFLFGGLDAPVLELTADEYGDTFEPEFVDAYELGMKNTLLGGAMTFNSTAFFYDYTDYQVSQIRDRTAVNENFDAKVWGIEFETLFAPSRNLQIVANLGYLDTEIAEGERSIDIINRNQGDPAYTVAKPWLQLPSNCVVPTAVVERWLTDDPGIWYWNLCAGLGGPLGALGQVIDPTTGVQYDPADYPELNGGAGLYADLGGNELPNAPHWTANVGAQYAMDMFDGWRATVRGDLYWQSQSYHRVYNYEPYDKLRGWYNANLSLWVENDEGLKIELYAKNILDDAPITDAFLNSDDTGLTTNVFTLDPRLIGLSIRKAF
ncbi:MAG TPA: TonB-dependent receptor, partial [Caulobacteraceae bacterium]|nr:TonB-dependent receptor [Caulobacteraceae bacterium]